MSNNMDEDDDEIRAQERKQFGQAIRRKSGSLIGRILTAERLRQRIACSDTYPVAEIKGNDFSFLEHELIDRSIKNLPIGEQWAGGEEQMPGRHVRDDQPVLELRVRIASPEHGVQHYIDANIAFLDTLQKDQDLNKNILLQTSSGEFGFYDKILIFPASENIFQALLKRNVITHVELTRLREDLRALQQRSPD
jgi:hypothetical protein